MLAPRSTPATTPSGRGRSDPLSERLERQGVLQEDGQFPKGGLRFGVHAEDVEQHGVEAKKLTTIHNGVDLPS